MAKGSCLHKGLGGEVNMRDVHVGFEPVNEQNLAQYAAYESVFESDLKNYQSRIYPDKAAQLCWYHIKLDDQYIGAIWLERKSDEDHAVLGLFIAECRFRNKGIGTAAIRKILEQDLSKLNVDKAILHVRTENNRAIACYEKAGFQEIARYQKGKNDVVEMMYSFGSK